ncbi:centromere-associated protein E isoform X3 [Sebastes umbrosus]|uniref:centromere-associated protein E isoform X3 n=1 Tax=Sebastes umbrosus TaxID=72105 RepID=UPI00189DBA9E|nr:centromere-associated protein E isoform X3 [Sebastes umbrosus]
MTEESAVKVCVRVRPRIAREESAASENAEPVQVFWRADKKSIHQIDDGNTTKSFSFDRVFTADETTNQLYQDIAKPLVVSSVEGYNGTIFAYGQTSSGKTFTMMGSDRFPGVIPLAVEDIFQTIKNCPKKEFLLRVSYMEIYNETVSDLLVDSWKRKPLEVRETINKNIYVADLTEELVTSPAQALAWIRKGEKNRHYGKTKMNQRSSRSHTIFRMILESRERSDPSSGENADGAVFVSHLNLVDLAGSERASQTGTDGARFKEGCNINRSLFILGQVIKKLTDEGQKGFTNYRDSKLTRILQNSLGGNAKTVIICTITPVALEETLGTLQFASTAKKMKNDPHVTEVSDDGALLKRYRNEIVDLKRRLNEVSSVTHTTDTEKKVLSQLLQEKDQLQREQQDRIRNLTKLLVTSSNLVPVRKMPKRRETWGGKMIRLVPPSACDGGSSDLSFAESCTRKRKADRSCLMELNEDDEDFDSQWEIPDEPQDDMEMSHSSVTVRSFGESPKDFVSPDRMHELSGKVSNLELQLEIEIQHKEEAVRKTETLDGRVAELELHLQTEVQQRQEALEKIQTAEQRAAELELHLQTEVQQKQEALEKIQRAAELELHVQTEVQQDQQALEKIQIAEQRVSELELHLQTEVQQKQEVLEKIQIAEQRVSELELHLQTEVEQKQEALEKIQTAEQRMAELELQTEVQQKQEALEKIELAEQGPAELELRLQTEVQQKQEALEKVEILGFRVADLERRLEEQSHTQSATDEQMRKEFAETIQLCETLATEKDAVVTERDYLKQELGMFIEQTECLERETAALSKEMEEKRETDEFQSLEEEFQKEHESELQNDISKLKKAVESSELRCLELQNKLETLSEELKKKTEFAEELQSMSGKDLVQEVANLRRSLDDAEGLSRDTKKEWAFLRSKNIAVEEMNVTLSATYEKMETEVKGLRFHLETEKSRYRTMQSDLQKELNVAFDENTKLTTLLDGKVPNNLIENMELERTVARLNRELTASHEAEGALKAQLEELASFQTLPDKVDSLMKQLNQLTEELQCVRAEKDALLSEHNAGIQSSAEETEKLLSTVTSLTAERDQLRTDLQENVEMMIENQDELRTALEKSREQKERIKQLETAQTSEQDGPPCEVSAPTEELQILIQRLSEELESVRAERDSLSSERTADTQTHREEMEKLLCRVTSVSEERDELQEILEGLRQENKQLRADMEDRMETMQTEVIENQEELRASQEKIRILQDEINVLRSQKAELEGKPSNGSDAEITLQLQELQNQIQRLTEELESVRAERDSLSSERTAVTQTHREEMEKLLCRVTSVGEERDELQEILEGLRQENKQLRAELEDRMETMQTEMQCELQQQLSSEPQSLKEEQEAQQLLQIQQLEEHLEKTKEEVSQLKSDLQENVELMIENQEELRASQEKIRVLQDEINVLRSQKAELEGKPSNGSDAEITLQLQELQNQIQRLTEELESVRAERDSLSSERDSLSSERDSLSSERTADTQTHREEMEKLLCRVTSVSEERDELQEILEGLRQENKQLRAELEDRMETMQTEMRTLTEKLESIEAERDGLSSERDSLSSGRTADTQSHREEMEKLLCRVTSVSEERDELQEILEGLRQENKQLRAELEDRMETMQTEMTTLTEKLESIEAERDGLLSEKDATYQTSPEEMEKLLYRATSASEERDELQEILEGLRQENKQLRAELEDRMETMQTEASTTQELMKSVQEELCEQKQINCNLEKLCQEKECSLDQQMRTLTEKLESIEAERDGLLSEKEANCRTSQEEIVEGLRQKNKQLRAQLEDRMETMQTEMRTLTEKLESIEAERDGLLSEKEDNYQVSPEEMEKLLYRATSASEERDELQEIVEGLRQVNKQLRAELEDRMGTVQTEDVIDEHNGPSEELKLPKAPADSQSSSLLQAPEGAPLKAELSLLKDNQQQLVLQLQQTEEKVNALRVHNEQLEDAQIKASKRVSNHKEATQLLQTELQNSRAQVEEKDDAIATLKSKLRESQKNASPSSVELEQLRTKLFKMEVELSSASDKRKQEIQRMSMVLTEKEESLRKLKEILRRSQQQGEESFLQGEDLHARLTKPRGLMIESSTLLQKNKLEEEVKQLQLKITRLESLLSSQQAEINKWKSRAYKLKVKSMAEADKPSSPCTPTKRGHSLTSDASNFFSSPKKFLANPRKVLDPILDSPRKVLDSPKVSKLDSPKSRFFDVEGSSELLSRTCPRQFFDNSSLGTVPEVFHVPDIPDAETDAAAGADRKEDWWPRSPNQEEMCKTQ